MQWYDVKANGGLGKLVPHIGLDWYISWAEFYF